MLIYGSNKTEVAKENLFGSCTHCGTSNTSQMVLYQNYFHLFWIPVFPTSKTAYIHCTHCKQLLEKKEFSPEQLNAFNTLKSSHRPPLRTFSGIFVFAILYVWFKFAVNKDDQRMAGLIEKPQIGDIYEVNVNSTDSDYTMFKVKKVGKDSIFVVLSTYSTNRIAKLNDILKKGEEAFDTELVAVSKTALAGRLKKGEIIGIIRE